MALTHWAFIYTAPGADPERDTRLVETGGRKTSLVAVEKPEQAVALVPQLVADGVQLIELCGAFGATWTAKVAEAADGKVPVGSVAYGAESIDPLCALFG
ncbi:hypothetical protein FAF44_16485 [Nonomuraea sp. MG754425]|uniref:DUF6506 family protein n=1 Tax=Nonomuraea sp. MG754425 TaxID=2570319 RepID=UPI001F2EF39E|nr:DUF6506 family protein [Nonomuraea sp. MG754425]MCF6469978.1 hypothetical protein [Nonomuraea sp. MG754425]